MKTSKNDLIKRLMRVIDTHGINECDPDVADLMIEADTVINGTQVDTSSLDEWIEGVRVANICQLS